MMTHAIDISPLVPWQLLLIGLIIVVTLTGILARYTSPLNTLLRALAMGTILLALLNPRLVQDNIEPVRPTIVIMTDSSPSQSLQDRHRQTREAHRHLEDKIRALGSYDILHVTTPSGEEDTRLFSALASTLTTLSPARIAGLFILTDGQIHDIPAALPAGLTAPVHVLLSGNDNERDRRLRLINPPRFGIVGQKQTLTFEILDHGISGGEEADLILRRDGDILSRTRVRTGTVSTLDIPIPHAGPNLIELETPALDEELTPVNNHASLTIDGIRDRMKVLLVSGEPHAGERAWRNLLKSDPNIDLVHFTILRPPEKQDGTPLGELALIAFPTHELFEEKINEFDLIIFDRYARQNILPMYYFDNIASYVKKGGALLVVAGPDFTAPASLINTPLESVLPATPLGTITLDAFRPQISEMGQRHPVTRLLASQETPPRWGHWFRAIDATPRPNTMTVMTTSTSTPLLTLSREGEGRTALLLSDHLWLWARGFEGGGPYQQLTRNLAHWLMREPDLEEEALRLAATGTSLTLSRQTLSDTPADIILRSPSGQEQKLSLSQSRPGMWQTTLSVAENGIWQASEGKLKAVAFVGPSQQREYEETWSTAQKLQPLVKPELGSIRRMKETEDLTIIPIQKDQKSWGRGWAGVQAQVAGESTGKSTLPLLGGATGLLILLAALIGMWMRERQE